MDPSPRTIAVLSRLRRLALTPIGRHKVRRHLRKYSAWPLLWPAALAYRRTLMSGTRILAVVGSVGKTTTTAAVCTALGLAPPRLHRNSWGSLALAALAIRPGQRHAVLEVGIDEPGQMIRYAGILRPDMVVVTAIASEHGRSLGSLDNIRDEKAQILRGLRPGGLVVLNGDDPRVRSMAASTDARVLTFGFGADNDVSASEPRLDWPYGTQLEVEIGGRTLQLRVRLLGRVTMYAVLAALTVAWAEGRPLDEVVRALEALPPRQGRMEPIRLPDGVWLIRDDFKSTLETIHAALDLLAEVPARRVAVLGDVSGRLQRVGHEAGWRYQLLGERLSTVVSRAVIIAGKESFDRYAAGASAAGQSGAELVHVRGVKAATEAVRADLRPGDVILIKGRQQQRLSRIALALQGRKVGCEIEECNLKGMRCKACPMLERGWVSPEGSNPRR